MIDYTFTPFPNRVDIAGDYMPISHNEKQALLNQKEQENESFEMSKNMMSLVSSLLK